MQLRGGYPIKMKKSTSHKLQSKLLREFHFQIPELQRQIGDRIYNVGAAVLETSTGMVAVGEVRSRSITGGDTSRLVFETVSAAEIWLHRKENEEKG